jgi:hypothetical protein
MTRINSLTIESLKYFVKNSNNRTAKRFEQRYFLRTRTGVSPKRLSTRYRHIADTLRDHGAETSAVRPIDELFGACFEDDADAAHSLVSQHEGILGEVSPEDHETIVLAVGQNRIAPVRLMAELGFDLNRIGENGATLLHIASWHGYADMVKLLLTFGARAPGCARLHLPITPMEALHWIGRHMAPCTAAKPKRAIELFVVF